MYKRQLLDNAFKWAVRSVVVQATHSNGKLRIVVEDDGPGCESLTDSTHPPSRGQRADESVPGSGLGLSIVRDLVTLYDGTLSFEVNVPNGLRVVSILPGGLMSSPS